MAYANLKTGEIVGAEKGTLTYYHEVGHLNYENNKRGRIIREIQEISNKFLIPFIVCTILFPITSLKSIIFILLIINLFSELIEEIDCWKYAKGEIKK